MTDFDVCTVLLPGMTLVTQVRGQNDNGNCLTASKYMHRCCIFPVFRITLIVRLTLVDQSCVNAIETQASNAANILVEYQTGSPTPNLTKGILPTVCEDIGQNLHNNFPKECKRYWVEPLPQPFAFGKSISLVETRRSVASPSNVFRSVISQTAIQSTDNF